MWDTAERYAHGASESTIGAWLASRPPDLARQIRITTKVAPASLEGLDGVLFDTDYVERKLDASLERVGRRRVAPYMAHALCETTPVRKTVEAFAAVIESGRTERIGCCNVALGPLLARSLSDLRIVGCETASAIHFWLRRSSRTQAGLRRPARTHDTARSAKAADWVHQP